MIPSYGNEENPEMRSGWKMENEGKNKKLVRKERARKMGME